MRSEIGAAAVIRAMRKADRAAVSEIITLVGNFSEAEIDCALELIDIYLQVKGQKDYRIAVCEDSQSGVQAYICWGPVPLTRGSYDIYWIATHPDSQGKGFGSSLGQVASIYAADVSSDKTVQISSNYYLVADSLVFSVTNNCTNATTLRGVLIYEAD